MLNLWPIEWRKSKKSVKNIAKIYWLSLMRASPSAVESHFRKSLPVPISSSVSSLQSSSNSKVPGFGSILNGSESRFTLPLVVWTLFSAICWRLFVFFSVWFRCYYWISGDYNFIDFFMGPLLYSISLCRYFVPVCWFWTNVVSPSLFLSAPNCIENVVSLCLCGCFLFSSIFVKYVFKLFLISLSLNSFLHLSNYF